MTQRPQSRNPLEKWARLLFNADSYALHRGRADEAEEMAVQSKDVRSLVLGHENAQTLNSMEQIGMAKYDQGRYREAEVIHRQILATRERVLGREHPDTVQSMSITGKTLGSQGKQKEAEEILSQTLAMTQQVMGNEHPDTLVIMNDIGSILRDRGKYGKSELMLRQTLVICQKIYGEEDPYTLTCEGDLATVLMKQGRWDEAEVMHRKVLATAKKILGRKHPVTLTIANNLQATLNGQGMYEDAVAMGRQTLATSEDVNGFKHPVTLAEVYNLASSLGKQGHYDESLVLFDRAYTGFVEVLGEDHPHTRQCYEIRSSTASQEQVECTAISQRNLSWVRDLAKQLVTLRRYDACTALYDKAYAEFSKFLGEDHPTTRGCYEDRSRFAAWLHARTAAGADTTSTPFDQESVASSETSSGASSPTEEQNGWREFPIEEATTHQKQIATDRSSTKLYHQESAHNGTSSRIPSWLGKPGIQSPRRKIKLQSSVTSLQRRIISFRDTSACGNVERNQGANSGASKPLTRKT